MYMFRFSGCTGRAGEKLLEKGHSAKANKTTENCFVSLAVTTIKKDESDKIALDSRPKVDRGLHQKESNNAK